MGHRILVAEDDAVIALFLEEGLRQLGHEVVALVSTGPEAIEAAKLREPSLVLMDISLPGPMDGIEAARKIRENADIPIVFATAHSDEGTLRKAKATEPYGFVLKPFNQNDVRVAVEIALQKHYGDVRLKRSEQRFATTLKAIAEAVIATNASGRIDFINRAAEELTGVDSEHAIFEPLTSLVSLIDTETRQPLATDVQWNGKALLIDSAGREIPVAGSIAAIASEDRQHSGHVLVLRNITEELRLEETREHERVQRLMIEVSEGERRRVGQDLHDGLGQMLTGIAFLSKTLEQRLSASSLPESSRAAKITELLGEAIRNTRGLASGLLPVPARPEGLALALERLAGQVESQSKVECEFVDASSTMVADPTVANHLFRIAQEALNNAVKHGRPSRVEIRLESGDENDAGQLVILDDGIGVKPDRAQRGSGFDIMRQRAAMIGGCLRIAGTSKGTRIVCSFPLKYG